MERRSEHRGGYEINDHRSQAGDVRGNVDDHELVYEVEAERDLPGIDQSTTREPTALAGDIRAGERDDDRDEYGREHRVHQGFGQMKQTSDKTEQHEEGDR